MARSNAAWKPRGRLWRTLRRSALVWWILAIAMGLLTATVVGSTIGQTTASANAWGISHRVWVVRRAVRAGDVFERGDVELARRPQLAIPEGALDATSSPIGEATRVDVRIGEVVLTERLAGAGAHGVAAMVPAGYRAVALKYDETMPVVRVGDLVDVIATFDVGDPVTGEAGSGDLAFAVASGVAVLRVTADAVTLAVDERDAPKVAFALAKAAITLALRGGEVDPSASYGDADDGETGQYPVDNEGSEAPGLDQP